MKNKLLVFAGAVILGPLLCQAQIDKKIKQLIADDSSRLTAIFKDIHQNPEPGFMEVRTARIVAKELSGLGMNVITGIAKTGVAGILKNGEGP